MKQLLPLLCLLTVASHAATLNVGIIKSYLDKPVPPYTPYAAGYSGTAMYARRQTVPAGLSDSSAFTLACWLDLTGSAGVQRFVMSMYSGANLRFTWLRTTTNTFTFSAYNSANTVVLSAVGSGTYTGASPVGYVHILLAVDLTNTSNRHLYTNGVEDASVSWNTYDTSGVIDFSMTSPDYYIAASSGGGNLTAASYSELWFDDTYLNDLSKFWVAGNPVSLGTTGETPKGGTVPVLYFSGTGSGASWNNSATASTFTITGTPSSPAAPP